MEPYSSKIELYSSNLELYSSILELYGSTLNKKVGIFELLRVEENISIFLWCWMWNRFFENPILRYFKIRKCRLTVLIGTIWFQVGTTGCPQKNVVSWKNSHNYPQTHPKCKNRGVLENSGYLLPNGHWDFKNWRKNDWENEA